MSRSVKIAVVALVVAVLLVGGNYALGFFFKGIFQTQIEETNRWWQSRSSGKASIQVESYDFGIFGATARTRITLGPQVVLFINHEIRHGLAAGLVSSGKVRSELELPQEVIGATHLLFGKDPFAGKAPITIDSAIGWTGNTHHRIDSPDFTGKAMGMVDVVWGGINGEFSIGAGQRSVAWTLELPSLSIVQDKDRLEISRLYSKGDTAQAGTHLFRAGQLEWGLDKALFRTTTAQRGSPFELENLKITFDTQENGGLVDLTAKFSLGRTLLEDTAVEAAESTFVIEHLDADAFDSFLKIVETLRKGSNATPKALGEALEQEPTLVPAIFRRKPVFTLKDSSIRFKQGEFRLNAQVRYVGENPADRFVPERDLAFDVDGGISRALLADLIGSKASKQIATDDAQVEEVAKALVTQLVDQQLAELTNKGFLIEKDGLLTATLHIQDKTQTLNGAPWDEEAKRLFSTLRP
jgi:uncharacterized protein YdgA (DUF945 family)